jgi:hypothetical protein
MGQTFCGTCKYFKEQPMSHTADGFIVGGETYCVAPQNRKISVKDGTPYGWVRTPDNINRNLNCKWWK